MLLVFGAMRAWVCPSPVQPPYTIAGASAARFSAISCVTLCCATPSYTTIRVNAAPFAAEGNGFLVRPLTMMPPRPGPRVNAACFGAIGVGFLCHPSLCYPRPTLHLR